MNQISKRLNMSFIADDENEVNTIGIRLQAIFPIQKLPIHMLIP